MCSSVADNSGLEVFFKVIIMAAPEIQVGPHRPFEDCRMSVVDGFIFRPVNRPRYLPLGHWKPLYSILVVEQTAVVDYSHVLECNEISQSTL